MNKKHREVCMALTYFEDSYVLVSVVSGWISISSFASLASITTGIVVSAVELKVCVIKAKLKSMSQYLRKSGRSMIKKMLLAKS